MSNESGKDFYAEYCINHIKCESREARLLINEQYIFSSQQTIKEALKGLGFQDWELISLSTNIEIETFKRAPKTQMINGHKVVAPRYDEPDKGVDIFYLDFGQDDGIYKDAYNQMLNTKIQAFGWFDNKPDAIAYANAHRENK